ncbi:MAG: hypothetical protein HY698_04885 [Deltaproteobacteria bacterium]|nr:hypothetical protein [Deltaproteobacteria bacterium]
MSLKRSNTSIGGMPRQPDASSAKIDRQDLWDELQERASSNEPFTPQDIALAMGSPEPAVAKALLTLAYERLLEKVEAGRYRAGSLASASQADFNKALAARIDPKRQQAETEIERLKKNNDEMRRRLLEAVADRDRFMALLKKHGIDPAEVP